MVLPQDAGISFMGQDERVCHHLVVDDGIGALVRLRQVMSFHEGHGLPRQVLIERARNGKGTKVAAVAVGRVQPKSVFLDGSGESGAEKNLFSTMTTKVRIINNIMKADDDRIEIKGEDHERSQ